MASPLQTLTVTTVLVSLLLRCAGMRYLPNSLYTTEIKDSNFPVNIVPQPSGLIPGLGRFLLPPNPKKPFNFYKAPLAAAPTPSYGIPSRFAPNPGYESPSPRPREDQVPPVPQP